MRKYKIEIELSVSENWIDDGFDLTHDTQISALQEYFEFEMLPYAIGGVETKANVKVTDCETGKTASVETGSYQYTSNK